MTKQKKLVFIAALLLLLAVIALFFGLLKAREGQTPVANARFVQRKNREDSAVNSISHVDMPLLDADGNAGAYPPENEVYYQDGSYRAEGHSGKTEKI